MIVAKPAVFAMLAALLLTACATAEPPPASTGRATAVAPTRPAVPTAEPTADPTTDPTAGPSVQDIAAALDAVSPTRHPRDNTGSCAAAAGCVGLVTAGTVSIYQWPSVSAASRYIGEGPGTAERIGPYVLSYRTTEQHSTPAQVRRAYADKVRALVGPQP